MRLLWVSKAPWTTDDYGRQTALVCSRLRAAGHEVAIAAYSGIFRGMVEWQGMPVYPAILGDQRTQTLIGLHYKHWNADFMIYFHDADQSFDGAAFKNQFPEARWSVYLSIQSEATLARYIQTLDCAFAKIATSEFGKNVLAKCGRESIYIPLGTDTKAYCPASQAEARALLGWPSATFISVITASTNKPQVLVQNIKGFADFHKKYPDSLLYLHSEEVLEGGQRVAEIVAGAGLRAGAEVIFCDPYRRFLGFSASAMASIYNGANVIQAVATDEPLGFALLDAQACGTPIIVDDWSHLSEFCFSGWKVTKSESSEIRLGESVTHRLARSEAIANRLEQSYLASKNPQENSHLRAEARNRAIAYEIDSVVENHWLSWLAVLQSKIEQAAK
jgi:glycosyltransferase involved in cell wall biosynthesis